MKKIIYILFLFLLFYSCYLIYNSTNEKKLYTLLIGDNIANIEELKNNNNLILNNDYINKDYHILDLLNTIKYNEENNNISIHRLLKKADIVIISIGMNDIYYKLNDDSKEIYTYLNNIINNYEEIFKLISKYDYQQVYVLGYYNITNKNNDIFTYINYKLKKITNNYNYNYIDLNNILHNNQIYLEKNDNFNLNNAGYSEINKIIVEKLKKT